jgi:hypothetical protein
MAVLKAAWLHGADIDANIEAFRAA